MTELESALSAAIERRRDWLASLQDTDCVRLLSGAVEGAPGVTIDRYGPVLLIQTGREPLDTDVPAKLAEVARRALGVSLEPVWNHRPAYRREGFDHFFRAPDLRDAVGLEEGMRFVVDPRRGGLDPLLFLDLRAGRRRVRELAEGKRVLNLFAYTCGLGVAAAVGGAREVMNVDFARSALDVGLENARLNGIDEARFTCVQEDVIPVIRQLAGLKVKGRGARRPFMKVGARSFDLVLLDPPRWAKTPFGAVDVVRDYPSLLKPALLALELGGTVLATNHVPSVSREDFVAMAERTAQKIGRRMIDVTVLTPDPDFPSPDEQPPLKMLLARVD